MSYHALANDSGGDNDSRVSEAHKIVEMLADCTESMMPAERNFVEKMAECNYCSPKQVFWLRDIKEKYL